MTSPLGGSGSGNLLAITCLRIATLLLCLAGPLQAKTIHVNAAAGAGGNGTSWATAFRYLQDALAQSAGGDQVWIAAGTYYPDDGSGITSGDRTATFSIKNSVTLIGGFAGTETNASQRIIGSNATVLSGEIWADSLYWSLHVVSPSGSATLDGVTITKGNANGDVAPFNQGGGIFNPSASSTSLTLTNCKLSENRAINSGGAIHAPSCNVSAVQSIFTGNFASGAGSFGGAIRVSAVSLTGCHFSDNTAADDGGAIHCSSPLTVISSSFTNNRGTGNASRGGAICVADGSTAVTLSGSTFTGNSAGDDGGAIYAYTGNVSTTVTECHFTGNHSDDNGGAIYTPSISPTLKLTRCTFSSNSSGLSGGAANASALLVDACSFSQNSAIFAGALSSSSTTVTNSTFVENNAEDGGGAISSSAATLTASTFTRNRSITFGGAVKSTKVMATGCDFLENTASRNGGAIYASESGSTTYFTTVKNCRFVGNKADSITLGNGGAIYSASPVTAINSIFSANLAKSAGVGNPSTEQSSGGAICITSLSTTPAVLSASNCLFVGNSTSTAGSGLRSGNGGAICFSPGSTTASAAVTNCTFLDNRHTGTTGRGHTVYTSCLLKCFNNVVWDTRAEAAGDHFHLTGTATLRNSDTSFPSPLDLAKNLIRGGSSSIVAESGAVLSLGDTSVTILDANPGFVNVLNPAGADAVWGNEDDGMCLLSNSPALDQGLARYLPADVGDLDQDGNITEATPFDVARRSRQQGASVDLGAYEIQPSSGYSSWVALHGLTGGDAASNATPAKDGVENLTKYALGMNPHTPARATDGTNPGLPAMISSGGSLRFVFLRNAAAGDLTLGVKASQDLLFWNTVTAGITETPLSGGLVKVEVLTGGNSCFYKLSISR